ncbi:MAG: hypothetical protein N2259_01130 [Patescibacteria group bacterium]|nr:hypothetical protein [Patescibacteria group bacterium]
MTLRRSLSLILISTIFFWLIVFVFFLFVDPVKGGNLALVILFLALFFGLLGFFTLFFIILKFRHLKEKEKIFEKFAVGFRQAFLFSFFLISLILLKFFKLLAWWSAFSSFLLIILLELIFSTRKKRFTYLENKS